MTSALLGAAVAAGSALLYDAGYILEKQALTDLPPVSLNPASLVRTAMASRRWLVGFGAMIVALALQVGALTLAPVSVVQPILAGGLIALAAAGGSVLGEKLDRAHVTALVLVLGAVVVVAVSAGAGGNVAREIDGARLAVLSVVVVAVTVAVRLADRSGLMGLAVSSGLLYGLGAVAEKAVATKLVSQGLVSGAWSALATPYPWLFLAATLAGMVMFQAGLQAHPASLMASLCNVTSTVCALVGASLIFDEALLPRGWHLGLRVTGFAAVLAAVALLGRDRSLPDAPGTVRRRPDHAVAP